MEELDELKKITAAWETIAEFPDETLVAVLASPEAIKVFNSMEVVRNRVNLLVQKTYN